MNAQLPLGAGSPLPVHDSEPLPDFGAHLAPAATTPILALHVHGVGCGCPSCVAAHRQTLALNRLADYLDAEGPTLERVLRLLDRPGGLQDLAALHGLHIEPEREAEALADATCHLERLLEELAETSTRAEIVGLTPAGDGQLGRNLDAAIRWLGARTQEVLDVVRRVLS